MSVNRFAAALAIAAGSGAAFGQVVINEVLQNPFGTSAIEDVWEFIEIYGKPGMKLDGYAIACVTGGADDGDGIPGPLPGGFDPGDEYPEIDEAFYLDGLTIGANGLLVLHNTNSNSFSNIPGMCAAQTTRAPWKQRSIPSVDSGGRLKNDGSTTFVLVRRRPGHSLVNGASVYDSTYAWSKDYNPDADFNSRLDFGDETALPGLPVYQSGALILEPYQMVDDVAWSNSGGKEYVRNREQEINDTPGFQPDSAARLAFYGKNPHRGWRINAASELEYTSMADEEFLYGETGDGVPLLEYNVAHGVKGPTDQNPATRYNELGQPDSQGTYFLDDINVNGFNITPGNFNDVDSTGSGGANIAQFRFVEGDSNFDGKWDFRDYNLIQSRAGATLDDTATFINDRNTSDPGDDVSYVGWKWQGREFQGLLVMMDMDPADGPGGANASFVTASDIAAAFRCPADYNGDGFPDAIDYDGFITDWLALNLAADYNEDEFVDAIDYDLFIAAFLTPCP